MKAKWIGWLLGAVTLLSSCNTVENRIQKYPERFSSLEETHQALIREGKIEVGMSYDAVFFAFGHPDRIVEEREGDRKLVKWVYMRLEPIMTHRYGYLTYEPGWGRSPFAHRHYLSRTSHGKRRSNEARYHHSHGRSRRTYGYYHRHVYGYDGAPEWTYLRVPNKEVIFENEKVIGWRF